MASNISSVSSMINSKNRMNGLVSGLDTDSLVKQMLKVDQAKVDKAKQDKQLLEWKRDAYRSVTNSLKTFRDTYLDVLSPTNMRSQNNYKVYNATSSDSNFVTASGNAQAVAGVHTIQVNNMAKSEAKQSAARVTEDVTGNVIADFDTAAAAASGKSFALTVDGVTKTIKIDSTVANKADLLSSIQNGLDAAFGVGKVDVSLKASTDVANPGEMLTFEAAAVGVNKISISSAASNDALSTLGYTSGANFSNRLDTLMTIDQMSAKLADGALTYTTANGKDSLFLTINGKQFTFSKDTTVSSMMSQINSDSTANVNMQYDEINDKFVITSKQMGEGNNLNIGENGSNFLDKVSLNQGKITGSGSVSYGFANTGESISVNINGVTRQVTFDNNDTTAANIQAKINNAFAGTGQSVTVDDTTNPGKLTIQPVSGNVYVGDPISGTSALSKLGITANYTAGEDAKVTIDGQSITRGSNIFNVSGVTYTILKETGSDTKTITLTQDVDKVYNNIKTFVDKYNELVSSINTELTEEKNRDYAPLTDDQKSAMKDTDITNWENKAKAGLLNNDNTLNDMAQSMRQALYDNIKGISGSLYSIGITTGDYRDKGKLSIDENKLKDAIKNSPDTVMNIFSKESQYSYGDVIDDKTKRTPRYNDNGIANRLYDIIQDTIRTTRDKDGNKGVLIDKAGIIGDVTEFKNMISDDIDEKDTQITDLLSKLSDKSDAYYKKFANLETYLNQMNSQSSWLSQQLGGSSS